MMEEISNCEDFERISGKLLEKYNLHVNFWDFSKFSSLAHKKLWKKKTRLIYRCFFKLWQSSKNNMALNY